MYISDINKISMILEENMNKQRRAAKYMRDSLIKKYGTDWFLNEANQDEVATYEKLNADLDDATEAYNAFMGHDWQ